MQRVSRQRSPYRQRRSLRPLRWRPVPDLPRVPCPFSRAAASPPRRRHAPRLVPERSFPSRCWTLKTRKRGDDHKADRAMSQWQGQGRLQRRDVQRVKEPQPVGKGRASGRCRSEPAGVYMTPLPLSLSLLHVLLVSLTPCPCGNSSLSLSLSLEDVINHFFLSPCPCAARPSLSLSLLVLVLLVARSLSLSLSLSRSSSLSLSLCTSAPSPLLPSKSFNVLLQLARFAPESHPNPARIRPESSPNLARIPSASFSTRLSPRVPYEFLRGSARIQPESDPIQPKSSPNSAGNRPKSRPESRPPLLLLLPLVPPYGSP